MSERLYPSTTRVLVTDDSPLVAEKLAEFLRGHGFQAKFVTSGPEAVKVSKDWKPHFVSYDFLMPEMNGPTFLKHMRQENLIGEGKSRVFMMSAHNSVHNVRECLRHGAADYLVKPLKPEDVLGRLVLHMQPKREVKQVAATDQSTSALALKYLHLTELLLRESLKPQPVQIALHNLMGMIALTVGAVRVSTIQCDLDAQKGTVRGANDKRDIDGFNIDLQKYPEIAFVLQSEKILALDNLKGDPTMAAVATLTKSISFNAIIVVPIRFGAEIWGAVSARLPDTKTALSDFDIRFMQLAGHVVGQVIARSELTSTFTSTIGTVTGEAMPKDSAGSSNSAA
jgi:CheY-like chemotaxis protein